MIADSQMTLKQVTHPAQDVADGEPRAPGEAGGQRGDDDGQIGPIHELAQGQIERQDKRRNGYEARENLLQRAPAFGPKRARAVDVALVHERFADDPCAEPVAMAEYPERRQPYQDDEDKLERQQDKPGDLIGDVLPF